MNEKVNNFYYETFIFFIFGVILFFGRIDLFYYQNILNPDEGQFIASAMRMTKYGMNFDSVYSGSSGPLNIIILMIPKLFGLEINLATTRIIDFLLLLSSSFILFKIIRLFSSLSFSFILTIPFVFFYTLSTNPDFLHYSGERLAVFLILLSIFLITRYILFDISRIYILGIILGLIPFTKIQAAPIAFLIGVCLILIIYIKEKNKKYIFYTIFLSLIPCSIFLIPLYINRDFLDFYYVYITSGVDYISKPLPFYPILYLIYEDKNFLLLFLVYFVTFIILFIIFILNSSTKKDKGILLFFLLIFLVTSYVIILPGRAFLHYLNFFIPIMLLVPSFLLIKILKDFKLDSSFYSIGLLILLELFFAFQFFEGFKKSTRFTQLNKDRTIIYKRDLFEWLNTKKNEELLIWGWMCQFYIDSNLISATKELLPYSYMYKVKNKEYFLTQYFDEFSYKLPNYVIDAVSPGSYNFNDFKTQSIVNNEKFFNILKEKYILITDKNKLSICPRIYLKKEKYNEINKELIKFNKIYSNRKELNKNIKNVNDSIVFETCEDSWVLPDGEIASLFIDFNKLETLKETLILNTKDGVKSDKATKELVLNYYNSSNKKIYSKKVALNLYPNWTSIKHEKIKDVKRVEFKILNYYGIGAGLNEIKFYR